MGSFVVQGWQRLFRRVLVLTVAVTMLVGIAPVSAQDQLVREAPLLNQPRAFDGRIYGIDSVGSTVVVGGTFTVIGDSATGQLSQPYLFKFDVTTGLIDQAFLPQIDGDVESVAIAPDGQSVYVGGNFITVNGVRRRRLVRISMADGSVMTGFRAQANARVTDIALSGDKLFAGGRLSKLNGAPVDRLVAVDSQSGDLLPAFSVAVTGTRRAPSSPFIQELDLSDDGRWIALAGNFNTVGGQFRDQVAVIEVGPASASVSSWSTDAYSFECGRPRSTYVRGIAIDPDSGYFVVNTTGFHHGIEKMCDSAARFELPVADSGVDSDPTWVTYTGGDTHWAVEVTDAAVYVGGHQRWENNPFPSPRGNRDGPGSVFRKGIAALDPLTGVPLSWDPGRHRGRGVEALHAGDGFLFVGSDTEFFNQKRVERLAVLPVDPSWTNPGPTSVSLPATLHLLSGANVESASFNGSGFGAATTISGPAIDGLNWTSTQGAFTQNGQLISFNSDDAYYSQSFDGASFGTRTNLSTSVGYVDEEAITPFDQPYGVAQTVHAAYDNGRIFYTKSGDSTLYWRGYSLESGIIGGLQFTASSGTNWSQATGLTVIDGQLYAAFSSGSLFRHDITGGTVGAGTLIDNGTAGIDWSNIHGLFATD